MTILVFGRTGQVATELTRQANVVALDRSAADLSNPAECAAAIQSARPSVVINAAAYTAVDKAESEEPLATLINGDAPTEMAKTCARLDIPFLHISTDYVFDGTPGRLWLPDDQTGPLGAYGRSKLAGEIGVRAAGGRHVILRTAWVFSAHGNNFVKTMLRLAETRDELNVVADQFGGPTPDDAIAAALLTISSAMRSANTASGTFHFAGTPATNWAGFAREIFEMAGKTIKVNDITTDQYPTPALRPANSVMDCSSLAATFGIEQPDWKAGIGRALGTLGDGGH